MSLRRLGLCLAAAAFTLMGGETIVYDRATEMTVVGILENVHEVKDPAGVAGIHFTLRFDRRSVDVFVAPEPFLRSLDIVFPRGIEFQVKGSKVKYSGGEVVLAREIRWESTNLLSLRDEQGKPFW